ncbi:SAG-related sequence [Besnoitia besnoiti]|uniref:SAG-related sequence n=1 Tax=Besnoitia besnoiti TaxID=94643 RepID=A0A2A9MER1_BESBE|nr:SAG-related sequence [Besnoitia besnoiti]PFH33860.1 SAG-related sequence [Besnoitia besnoiti]
MTLSKGRLTATLKCTGQNINFVPDNLKSVCAQKADLNACKEAKKTDSDENQVPLQLVLPSNTKLKWNRKNLNSNGGEVRTLQPNASQLPLEDTSFFVGCQKDNHASKCKLDITVQARASSVESNVAKCAYGQHSNPQPLLVELTPQNNTLTLECGKDHPIEPTNHTTYYCEDEKMKACTKTFKDILPNFDASWWSKTDETNNHVKLEIPPTEFPSADQQFYIGCSPNPGESVEAKAVLAASKTLGFPAV